ncbi:MAG: isopenicillin N synthase family oxygenase [Okeania sp. SIO3B5]|uniref:2OG-Fe(II) oxygenase family protein n=1 Tax=Okeania sp. SIO3B5 TaxID=2607811 RepID=UPI0013FE7317|nr:2OG-Fe(II) oxygenase family protein [Okeania sp. SIO3B5]NEO55874.1 isopenicillin N synthase family oxygenase [Okeania sp. SIO3B5]
MKTSTLKVSTSRIFETFDIRAAKTLKEQRELGERIVAALQRDSLIQIKKNYQEDLLTARALLQNKKFNRLPQDEKIKFVSDTTYTGYVFSGEEKKGGRYDQVEVYTVFPHFDRDNERVKTLRLPCHGEAIYPSIDYKDAIEAYMKATGNMCDQLIEIIGLGLGLEPNHYLSEMVRDGFHHARVLRFKSQKEAGGASNGISAHSDYGFLIAASQDDVGGLWVRPVVNGEKRGRNYLEEETTIGAYDDKPGWAFVTPQESVWTVFVGDMMELATQRKLKANIHKVKLNEEKERFAIAYFHEPKFNQTFEAVNSRGKKKEIVYGKHLTNMYVKAYPNRSTTKRIESEELCKNIDRLPKISL